MSSIPTLSAVRVYDQDRQKRRSVADAIEVMRRHPGFTADMRAEIRIGSFGMPSGEKASVVVLYCSDLDFAVTLPTSVSFTGLHTTGITPEIFEISRLQAATVDCEGNVQLADGTYLHAVQVKQAQLPSGLTPDEWFIVHAAISFARAQRRCYQYPNALHLPQEKYVAFNALSKLKIRGLKAFTKFAIDRCGGREVCRQTIANTLKKCGIGTERRRKRRVATFSP